MRFIVHGQPVAQPRPRVKRNGHTYTPRHAIQWRNAVAAAYLQASGRHKKRDGPVAVSIDIISARPSSSRRPGRELDTRRGRYADADNYAKAILDALNGVAYADDAQVTTLRVRKWIAAPHEQPHAAVELGDDKPQKAAP